MKTFKEICMMSKDNVKSYMEMYLKENGYEPINEDGFLYAQGDVPVLLVAHMDTVHVAPCCEIHDSNGKISSPQGIGGDDRCGIFIIMSIIKDLKCSVLLCEDEEKGGIGARKFTKTEHVNSIDANYIIEFDRKGSNDAVFYNCNNKYFVKFVTENTTFKEQKGSFSDISIIAPAVKIAAVNLSCGYYEPHTTKEYVLYSELENTIAEAKKLIQTECTEQFEYIERLWGMSSFYSGYKIPTNVYQQTSFDDYVKKTAKKNAADELKIHLEVCWIEEDGAEMCDEITGSTKAECWAIFFMTYTNVCFDMIDDYAFY